MFIIWCSCTDSERTLAGYPEASPEFVGGCPESPSSADRKKKGYRLGRKLKMQKTAKMGTPRDPHIHPQGERSEDSESEEVTVAPDSRSSPRAISTLRRSLSGNFEPLSPSGRKMSDGSSESRESDSGRKFGYLRRGLGHKVCLHMGSFNPH